MHGTKKYKKITFGRPLSFDNSQLDRPEQFQIYRPTLHLSQPYNQQCIPSKLFYFYRFSAWRS